MDSCKLPGTQNPQLVKETTEKWAAVPKLLNLPLEFQFLWLKQLPETSLCPNGCDCPTAQPWSSLVWGWSTALGAPLLLEPWLCYLERWELLWDWLEDVVTPLSWEKPLLQDSRLDMDPLGWDRTDVLLGRQQSRDNYSSQDQLPLSTTSAFWPIISHSLSKNLCVMMKN